MLIDIRNAKYCGDYKIQIEFINGKKGIVDFSSYKDRGGVFKKFCDEEFFKKFKINSELGVLDWNNEIDIAPEVLYSLAIKCSLPAWMAK